MAPCADSFGGSIHIYHTPSAICSVVVIWTPSEPGRVGFRKLNNAIQ